MERTIGDILIDHARVAKSLREFNEQCKQTRRQMYRKILEKGGNNGDYKEIQG